MVLKIIGITIVMIVVFIVVRRWALSRGASRRDDSIRADLAPVLEPLARGERPSPDAVLQVAAALERRPLLYAELARAGMPELFPAELATPAEQARALLAHHLMHPSEMQEPPVELEALEVVHKRVSGEDAAFQLVRFRMRDGHWTGHGWWLGAAGPFRAGAAPFAPGTIAVARAGDRPGEIQPAELADWVTREAGVVAAT